MTRGERRSGLMVCLIPENTNRKNIERININDVTKYSDNTTVADRLRMVNYNINVTKLSLYTGLRVFTTLNIHVEELS